MLIFSGGCRDPTVLVYLCIQHKYCSMIPEEKSRILICIGSNNNPSIYIFVFIVIICLLDFDLDEKRNYAMVTDGS